MNNLFLVKIKNQEFLYDKKGFLNFCSKIKNYQWCFYVGDLNSNTPFKLSNKLKEEELFKIFTKEELEPLLKYKHIVFGSTFITEMPFFGARIYFKYGTKEEW